MAATATTPITNTTAYPVFATKAAFMLALRMGMETRNEKVIWNALFRLSNTDTDNWTAASTTRHDA